MLSFDYSMELDFEGGEAHAHAFTLHCLPQETAAQHVQEMKLVLRPETELSYGTDAFGNRYCYGVIQEPHRRFQVEVSGTAERTSGCLESASEAAAILYRQATAKTKGGPVLHKMLLEIFGSDCAHAENRNGDSGDPACVLRQAEKIRDYVHDAMRYIPGTTSYATSAEEAADSGAGVCQDYAHIMLALCRMRGISCRYTAGLLMGEGASHAWVEVLDHGVWVEMDPTNPAVLSEDKLIFSHGRDAVDCEINRGIFLGPGEQLQKVKALLENVAGRKVGMPSPMGRHS